MRTKVCMENFVLVMICLADMLVTLYCVTAGIATEQNPLMAVCINHSPMTFVLVKTASFMPFVIAVEYYRRRNPDFARSAARCAIALYLVTYVVFTIGTNTM